MGRAPGTSPASSAGNLCVLTGDTGTVTSLRTVVGSRPRADTETNVFRPNLSGPLLGLLGPCCLESVSFADRGRVGADRGDRAQRQRKERGRNEKQEQGRE